MSTTNLSGPQMVYGATGSLPNATYGGGGSPDPNPDAGPSGVFQGTAWLDPRIFFNKDGTTGATGVVQAHLPAPHMKSISQIPAALGTSKIAAAQAVVSGTAMTLAAASVGVERNIPVVPFSAQLNGSTPVTAAIALDYGFGFGNVTSGDTSVTVSSSSLFWVGMPIVIARVGNSGGTAPLLTMVTAIEDATTITIMNAPLASSATAAIGTGNLWGPSTIGYPTPTAAFPFLAQGPAMILDPRQAISRGISITGAGGSTGGGFLVSGYDIYGQPMSELVSPAAAATAYSFKTFKYITSVTPQFTDAANYNVGTTDYFGFGYRSTIWEYTDVYWNGARQASATGWVAADTTSPATTTTNDVRGAIQTGASGPGSGIGANASNGTISSLAMSGRRLEMGITLRPVDVLQGLPTNAVSLFGVTQA
jgi:hypothetical protein